MRLPLETAATLHQHSKRGRVAIEVDIGILQIGTTATTKAEPFETNRDPWTEISLQEPEENIYAELKHQNQNTTESTLRRRIRFWFRRLCCIGK
jgi:hypothetical protein